MEELTDAERELLAFERRWWRYPGAKEDEIRRVFDISPTRYHQRLLALIERPEALAHDPATVRRLQRLRDARRARRAS